MKSRKEKVLFNLLLGTGIYLLDTMRNRMSGTVDDLRSRAQDTYETASDRVSRATDVIRGEDGKFPGHRWDRAAGSGHWRGHRSAARSRQRRRNPQQHHRKSSQYPRPGFSRVRRATGTYGV